MELKFLNGFRHEYYDLNGNLNQEIILDYLLCQPIEGALILQESPFFIYCNRDHIKLRVPIINDTLKIYYSNYKDYYYLPKEDTSILKSIATSVDPAFRENAKKETCYTKYTGLFIPTIHLSNNSFHKSLKESYGYQIYEEEQMNNNYLSGYGEEIIFHLFDKRKNSL